MPLLSGESVFWGDELPSCQFRRLLALQKVVLTGAPAIPIHVDKAREVGQERNSEPFPQDPNTCSRDRLLTFLVIAQVPG